MVDVPSRDEFNRVDVRTTALEAAAADAAQRLDDVAAADDSLSAQVAALAQRVAALEQGGGTTDPPPPPGLPVVQPVHAEQVRQSWIVNAHPGWASGVYAQTDAVFAAASDLGLPGIRDRVAGGASKAKLALRGRYADAGIRCHATLGVLGDTEQAVRAAAQVVKANPGLFRSVGGANEPNATGTGWPAKTATHQSWIWSELGGTGMPVYGPALKDNVLDIGADYRLLGGTDIASSVDFGDCHRYPRGQRPSNGLAERMDMSRAAFGGKPTGVTETGYNTSATGSAVTESLAALYAPRQLLEAYWSGSVLTGVFELLDQSSDPTVFAGHYGLVATPSTDPSTWRRKPSFDRVAALAAFMRDEGAAYTPAPVALSVGGPDDLRYLVLGWRDGSARLVLWRDVDAGAAAVNVTVATRDKVTSL